MESHCEAVESVSPLWAKLWDFRNLSHAECRIKSLACLKGAGCFLAVPGTLGTKVAAPRPTLVTGGLREQGPLESSASQHSGGSCSGASWTFCFKFWVEETSICLVHVTLEQSSERTQLTSLEMSFKGAVGRGCCTFTSRFIPTVFANANTE